jgi:predicted DNA-binding transcriptional regulator AlpA
MKNFLHTRTIPTGLRRNDAASHCGVSPSFFDRLVSERVLPQPRRLGVKVLVWMRQELDDALLSLPVEHDDEVFNNPCDRLLG